MPKAAHFEAKKHAYRQTQDGIVISFVVHPNDVSAELATAPLGTRYMVAFAAIGDDEKPAEKPEKAEQPRKRRRFEDLTYAEQAGLLCADDRFQKWMGVSETEDAAGIVRKLCNVRSRSEITTPFAVKAWTDLVGRYRTATGQETELRS